VKLDSGSVVVWVLRHAKAAANGPEGDYSRPLTRNGRRQAELVRQHLETLSDGNSLLPELVLCSPAARARETAELVLPAIPDAEIEYVEDLYSIEADELLDLIKEVDARHRRLMVVGHNPTLHEFCLMLARPTDSESIEELGLPTACLVGLGKSDVAGWEDLRPGKCRMFHRFVPEF